MSEAEASGLTIRELVLEVRDGMASLAREIRDTKHQVRSDIRAIEMRVIELERFRTDSERRHSEMEDRADHYIPIIEELTSQAKITNAVRTAMEQSHVRQWTRRERVMAVVLTLFAAVGAIGTIFSVFILRVIE